MPRTSASPKGDTFTFRLDPAMKAALARSAAADRKQPGEVVRDLVRDYLARRERRAFEAEARRQSLELNARAQDPTSDEAQVMRELEADLDAFADEWR
jgi:predicted transcriptional regulator